MTIETYDIDWRRRVRDEKRDFRAYMRKLRQDERDREVAKRLRWLEELKKPPSNDERFHAQARTLYFFMHKHLDVVIPKRPSEKARKEAFDWIEHRGCNFKQTERVGTRNVTIACHFHSRKKDDQICTKWGDLDHFVVTFTMQFKNVFFWTQMRCEPDTGDIRSIEVCTIGCNDDRIPLLEKLCRRYDGIMVMQKMIDAQDDYEGVP